MQKRLALRQEWRRGIREHACVTMAHYKSKIQSEGKVDPCILHRSSYNLNFQEVRKKCFKLVLSTTNWQRNSVWSKQSFMKLLLQKPLAVIYELSSGSSAIMNQWWHDACAGRLRERLSRPVTSKCRARAVLLALSHGEERLVSPCTRLVQPSPRAASLQQPLPPLLF